MTDFIGQKLKTGDEVVYPAHKRTYSFIRLTENMVIVKGRQYGAAKSGFADRVVKVNAKT